MGVVVVVKVMKIDDDEDREDSSLGYWSQSITGKLSAVWLNFSEKNQRLQSESVTGMIRVKSIWDNISFILLP